MASWMRGIVKEVPSGDTVVIVGTAKVVPPPEKRITLSSLIAPKLGKRDGSSRDEPFAWDAREFLRKKLIGQPVVFKVDYVVEQIGNREFGSVFLEAHGEKENVALTVAANGWAKVRGQGKEQSPYIEDLKKAEEAAQIRGAGIWCKDSSVLTHAVRDLRIGGDDGMNAPSILNSVGKGKPVTVMVEQVLNGSTLRVVLPGHQTTLVTVAGVQCPSLGRRVVEAPAAPAAAPTPAAEPAISNGDAAEHVNGGPRPTPPAPTSNGVAPGTPSAAAIAGTSAAEPFSREAKWLTESKVLNRDIKMVFEGIDKYNNLFATVWVPDAEAPGGQESLAEALVKAGYAKVVEWSANLMASGAVKLRELERTAKNEKRALWTNHVPIATGQTKLSDTFTGKVIEVVSGDCLSIKDMSTGVERRVTLSSIRAPRPATRERAADLWASEAKDFLRKKLVGREVDVKMEYTRKVMTTEMMLAGDAERVMSFGNVELVPEGKGEERQNVSELAVARGFATVVRHRTDEERSSVYEKLVECEELAKQAKRGVHSPKEPPVNRVNDVSQPGSAARAKQFLPFLQRAGRLQATVEYVLSGHRLRLHIPKEGATIVFAPSGIKTPARAMPAGNGKPAQLAEPYADEAISFTREHMMQRDVEVVVETVDRGGTFLGTIVVPGSRPFVLPLALLKAGLGRLQPTIDPSRLEGGAALADAQAAAQAARLKIWENWSPAQEQAEEVSTDGANGVNGASASEEVLQVTVTDVVDASEFFVQMVNEPRVAWIAEQLASLPPPENIPPELKAGQLCLGRFSLDNNWYRAYVERVNPREPIYEVFFIDFGNKEKLDSKAVRTIEPALAAVPPQAHLASLAYIKVPIAPADYANEAKACLTQLVGGGQALLAQVVGRERPEGKTKHPRNAHGKLIVSLVDPEGELNVGVEMLLAGLARLPKLKKVRDPAAKDAISKLAEFEDEARSAHRGMFQYGDPGDSDDEVAAPPKPAAWGKK